MNNKKTLILLSGGLDSVCLLHYLKATGENLEAVHLEYGANHCKQEKAFATQHAKDLGVPFGVVKLPKLQGSRLTGGAGNWVVPARNSVFLSIAANIAEARGCAFIAYGSNADDAAGFPDCTAEWVGAFNMQLAASALMVRLVAPFLTLTKRQLVYFTQKVAPGAAIEKSWSCYEGTGKPCGKCPACEKRQEALR